MQAWRSSRTGRGAWASIAIGLFALSILAPTVWRGFHIVDGPQIADLASANEDALSPTRIDAYVRPDLAGPAGYRTARRGAGFISDRMAPRVGQAYSGEDSNDSDPTDEETPGTWDVLPPQGDESYVGLTHGEPASVPMRPKVMPAALLAQLEALAKEPSCRSWAARTAELVRAYVHAATEESAVAAIEGLQRQIAAADSLSTSQAEGRSAAAMRRVRHALLRRTDIWKAADNVAARQTATFAVSHRPAPVSELQDLSTAVAAAERFVYESPHGPLWAQFLRLPQLREAMTVKHDDSPEQSLEAIRQALSRFHHRGFTVRQRAYLRHAPLVALRNELLRLTDEPVDMPWLMELIETYETEGLPSDAQDIAAAIGRLTRSEREEEQQLGRRLAQHYRGTNLRVAFSAELLNRFLPRQDEPAIQPVRDTIMGVPVAGQSLAKSDLRVRLSRAGENEAGTVRLQLQATGHIASDTIGRSGPVSAYSHTDAQYLATKVIDFEPDGLRSYPVRVESLSADSQLQSLQTDFDGLPIVGDVVRAMAGWQYQATDAERRFEVESKVRARIERQFEEQAAPLLSRLNRSFAERVLVPLSRLDLQPEAVIEQPPDERMNLRFRLASEQQLAAHTPRPRGLAGSLASLQVHESMLNNVLERLRLDGRTMNAKDLISHINRKLNINLGRKTETPENAERLTLTFADQDALRVRLAEDRLLLTVSLAKLEGRNRQWHNLQILVPYALRPHGASVQLVQAAELSLKGRISNRSQMIIRGILTNFFDSDAKYDLLGNVFDAERFADVHVAQVVITDGWLGLSMMEKAN